MPRELINGGRPKNVDGDFFCFGFNLRDCRLVQPWEKCLRGLHMCCCKGCKEKHSMIGNH